MADNSLELIFKQSGLQSIISNMELFEQLMIRVASSGKRVNTDNLRNAFQQLSNEMKLAGTYTKEFAQSGEKFLKEFGKEWLDQAGKVNEAGRSIQRSIQKITDVQVAQPGLKAFIAKLQEVQAVAINTKIDFGVEKEKEFNNNLKKILNNFQKIQDPVVKIKTGMQVLTDLTEQYRKQVKAAGEDWRKKERIQNSFNRAAGQVGAASGATVLQDQSPFLGTILRDEIKNINNRTEAVSRNTKIQKDNIEAGKAFQKQLEDQRASQQKMNDSIGIAIGKLIRYRVAFYTMRAAIQEVRSSIEDFINLQFQLADLEKVINRQRDSIDEYRKSANLFAREFGGNIKDIVGVMKTWAQTGLDQNKALEATKATLIGVNALGSTTEQVTEALTAAIFTYGVQVEDVTRVVSKWLAVQREFPINAQDLANSLKVVGAAAQVVGVDLNDLAGYVAAIGSATRKSGAAVGQSLKTMFARLPRREVISAFESINVSVLKNATELRDLDNVLGDLSKVWDNLSSVQKSNIAVTFGGIRRYSDFIALMDNWETKVRATVEAQQASTEAFDANQLTIQTLKKEWDKAKASFEEFGLAVGRVLSGPLKSFISLFSNLSAVLADNSSIFGKIGGAVVAFISTIAGMSIAILGAHFLLQRGRKLWQNMRNEILATSAAKTQYAAATGLAHKAQVLFNSSFVTGASLLSKFNLIAVGLSLLLGVVAAAWSFMGEQTSVASEYQGEYVQQAQDTIGKLRDQSKALKTSRQAIEDNLQSLDKLTQKLKESAKGSKEYEDASKRIETVLSSLPRTSIELIDQQNKFRETFEKSGTAVQTLSDSLKVYREELDKTIESVDKATQSEIDLLKRQTERRLNQIKREQDVYKTVVAQLKQIKFPEVTIETKFDFIGNRDNVFREATDIANEFQRIIAGTSAAPIGFILTQFANQQIKLLEPAIKEFNEKIKAAFDEGTDERKNLLIDESYLKKQFDNIKNLAEETANSMGIDFNKSLSILTDVGVFKDFVHRLNEVNRKEFTEDVSNRLANLLNTISSTLSVNVQKVISSYDSLDEEARKLQNTLSGVVEEAKTIDTKLNLGNLVPQVAISKAQQLEDILKGYQEKIDRLDIEKLSVGFEDIFDYDKRSAEESIKFVTDAETALLGVKRAITKLEEEQGQLATVSDLIQTLGNNLNETELGDLNRKLRSLGVNPDLANTITANKDATQAWFQEVDKTNNALEELNKISEDERIKNAIKEARKEFETYQKRLAEAYALQLRLSETFDPQIKALDSQIEILSKFKGTEEEILRLEKERADIVYSKLTRQAGLEVDLLKKRTILLQAANEKVEAYRRALEKAEKSKIAEILSEAADNALILEKALSSAFENIPTNIIEGTRKRKDLAEDLRDTEFDLQEARRSGDKQAIADAQYRLDIINKELKEYKAGWTEIKQVLSSVFQDIGNAFYQRLSDQVAENLSNITINGQTLGSQVGDAVTNATNNFISDWRQVTNRAFDEHETELNTILRWHANKLQEIFIKDIISNEKVVANSKDLLRSPSFALGQQIAQSTTGEQSFQIVIPDSFASVGGNADFTQRTTPTSDFTTDLGRNIQSFGDSFSKGLVDVNIKAKDPEIEKDESYQSKKIKDAISSLGVLIANSIGTAIGGGTQAAATGASLGGLAGSLAFTGSTIAPIVGSIVGGLIGGLLGGGDKEPQKPLINALNQNTVATINNTLALKELEKLLINVPTRFNIPTFNTGGFGAPVNITINSNADANEVARAVNDILNDNFDVSFNTNGSRGFAPI